MKIPFKTKLFLIAWAGYMGFLIMGAFGFRDMNFEFAVIGIVFMLFMFIVVLNKDLGYSIKQILKILTGAK